MDSIRGVLSFVKAVATGSFAAAGRELNISSVAVGKNVARLERELGVRLLQRSTRKLGLTEEGRLFYENCAGPLRELESARSAARDRTRSVSGTVRVTAIAPFALSYLLPLLPAFSARYPDVEIELHLDYAASDMIEAGYDVGIRVGRLTIDTVVSRPIAVLRFVVCGSPDYLARSAAPKTPADLASHNCLRFRHPTTGRVVSWTFVRGSETVSPAVHGNFISNDLEALIVAATHGQGLANVPLPRVLALLRRGELEVVLPDWLSPGIEVFFHYPSRKGLPARVKVFVEFMLERLRKHPDLQTDAPVLLEKLRNPLPAAASSITR